LAYGSIPSVAPYHSMGAPTGATNLLTNGGFETDTTGWATTANNTIARSTVQKHSGAASLLCTFQDQVGLARNAITLTAAAHMFSVWVYIPTAYDGESVVLSDNGDFVGATGTQLATADMGIRDAWQKLSTDITPVAGDLTGAIHVRNSGANPTAGRFIYIDDAQIETGTIATPFISTDGSTASRARSKWVA
jgi:hypothetical protein